MRGFAIKRDPRRSPTSGKGCQMILPVRHLSLRKLFHILPSQCLLCRAPTLGRPLCFGCHTTLPWNRLSCIRCGIPVAHTDSVRCTHCLTDPPLFHQAVCALEYRSPCSNLLNRFKHQGKLACGRLLAELLGDVLELQRQSISATASWPEIILPVPLHWSRLQKRGFDQSLEIAKVLSKRLSIPLSTALYRQRHTDSQQRLGRDDRRRNLHGAFALKETLRVRRVALIDDVLTTGSTAEEISQLLATQGIETIHIWTIARTPDPSSTDSTLS